MASPLEADKPRAPESGETARLIEAYARARGQLLEARDPAGHWVGELSTSALSTATAVVALTVVSQNSAATGPAEPEHGGPTLSARQQGWAGGPHEDLIRRGLSWLATHQNADGGWGDTIKSISNISTAMLCHAAFHAAGAVDEYEGVVQRASDYIHRVGGIPALKARYGKDKTFSVPILTHCALAGLVDWKDVRPLPFELACLPAEFYRWVRLPVVSYALPALIAVGQARFHHAPPRNLALRVLRGQSIARSLKLLGQIQPSSGGFLEATPLTSFVVMSLASIGQVEQGVVQLGVEFLRRSVRADGSWPIDTNLSTWVTTLAINALGGDIPAESAPGLIDGLLAQQHVEVHPYTQAPPGGWAWTDLPGGVPDGDDTPGAMLALLGLADVLLADNPTLDPNDPLIERVRRATAQAAEWLLGLQNGDGGWPTFCRGWGALPFDRSAPDITAHVLRALYAWRTHCPMRVRRRLERRCRHALQRGMRYLQRRQRTDGAWLPLWFGNQFSASDENPVYGTSRVLAAYRGLHRLHHLCAIRAMNYLRSCQNADGGWGGAAGLPSSIEETSLAVTALLPSTSVSDPSVARGLAWLIEQVDRGNLADASPIGFYFAKLWYFEKLYPMIFATEALRRSVAASSG